ncbi:MAG: acyl-CoA dehydrogenase, partial [Flavobacterium sp.]|nr:acyl-CoA dehydrogenase [Aeromicrobium sp.]
MEFGYDSRTRDLIGQVEAFMDEHVYPAEALAHEQMQAAIKADSWEPPAVLKDLQAEARKRGLWNFSLPGAEGAGLTNLQYAPLAEITGRSIQLAPAAFNCAAP